MRNLSVHAADGTVILLRPDRPEPPDRFAPGIKESELRALIADLEALTR